MPSPMMLLAHSGEPSYIEEVKRRNALPPVEPGLPVDSFFGEKPNCLEPDCDGVLLLPRDPETFELREHAYCCLCGRRYKVIK